MRCKGKFRENFSPLLWESPSKCSATESITIKIVLSGRAYFSAPEIDGKVYFNAREASQGETYQIKINRADSYDLYGETEDYRL